MLVLLAGMGVGFIIGVGVTWLHFQKMKNDAKKILDLHINQQARRLNNMMGNEAANFFRNTDGKGNEAANFFRNYDGK